MNIELSQPVQQSAPFPDRDRINNIWNIDPYMFDIRSAIKENSEEYSIVAQAAINLLDAPDPYQVKYGIQIIRALMWNNSDLTEQWVTDLGQRALEHPHPRIRHSALWNTRSAVWNRKDLAPHILQTAKQQMRDTDEAVQRVAMWTHGDVVLNDPDLFEEASVSMARGLSRATKESSFLFALEEYYLPLKNRFGTEDRYVKAVTNIQEKCAGMLGTKTRCALLIDGAPNITPEDEAIHTQRLEENTAGTIIEDMIYEGDYEAAAQYLIEILRESESFSVSMKGTWLLRDIMWKIQSQQLAVFQCLSGAILKSSDGDFARTASIVLGDCAIQAPEDVSQSAFEFVETFFKNTDNDGSQIVIAQTLYPLLQISSLSPRVREVLMNISGYASNESVQNTLLQMNNE